MSKHSIDTEMTLLCVQHKFAIFSNSLVLLMKNRGNVSNIFVLLIKSNGIWTKKIFFFIF